jgi:hypothetical protein
MRLITPNSPLYSSRKISSTETANTKSISVEKPTRKKSISIVSKKMNKKG